MSFGVSERLDGSKRVLKKLTKGVVMTMLDVRSLTVSVAAAKQLAGTEVVGLAAQKVAISLLIAWP